MSAYIVDKNQIDLVVWAACAVRSRVPSSDERLRNASLELSSETKSEHRSVLGRTLYDLNWEAVSHRYPGETKEGAPGPIDKSDVLDGYSYTEPEDVTRKEAHRYGRWLDAWEAVQFLLYQCAEGDVPDSKLYRFVEGVGLRVAGRLLDPYGEEWLVERDPQGRHPSVVRKPSRS